MTARIRHPWADRRALRAVAAACLAAVALLLVPAAAHAGFGFTKLHLNAPAGTENYVFAAGGEIFPEGSGDAGKYNRMTVTDSAGTVRSQTPCALNGAGLPGSYSVLPTDPAASGTSWDYTLDQWDTAACSGGPKKTATKHFTVAKAQVWSDAALTTPVTSLPPGATAYLRITGAAKLGAAGDLQNGTDWDVTWHDPSGASVCTNDGGGDRPDSTGGTLPDIAGHYLQYRPSPTDPGDDWNWESKYNVRPCADPTVDGTWRLELTLDPTHFVTLDAFTIASIAAPTIDASPATPGTGLSPSWSFSGGGGTGYECRLMRGATTVFGWASCTSAKTYSLAGQPDGSYTFGVRATSGGSASAEITSTYVLDTTPPSPAAFTSEPVTPDRDPTVSWAFTSEPGATFECKLELGLTIVSDWSACPSPAAFDLSALADGTYTFSVRSRDALGNTAAPTISTYVLDRTAPGLPVLTSEPATPDNDPAPSWSFTAEPSATTECKLVRGAAIVSDWTACSSPRSYDLGAQPDATYTFSVRATDSVGNVGNPQTSTYVLDRVAPAGPAITSPPTTPDADPRPQWSFTGEPGAALWCRLQRGTTTVSDWTVCTDPAQYDLTSEPDGTYTFAVHAVDAAGNVSGDSLSTYALDTQPPAAPTTSGPSGPGNDDTPEWSFTAEAGATFECRLEQGGTGLSGWAACTDPFDYDLTGRPDGTYTFRVRATDAAGNTGPEGTATYDLDRQPPGAVSLDATPPPAGTDTTPAWSFSTAETGVTLECRVTNGGTVVADWATCATPYEADLSLQPDATFTFAVRARDAAGNAGPSTTSDYTLDTTASNPPTIDAGPGSPSTDDTPQWAFTGEAGATLECHLVRGGTVVSDWTTCSGTADYDLSGEADGSYTFSVRATDLAGNTGGAAAASYVLDRTPPNAPGVTAPAGPSQDATPDWSFTGEAGASFACRLARGTTTVDDWGGCTDPYSYDLAGEPDGTYTLHVRATDAVGNTGNEGTADYILDRTAPAAPSIAAAPPSPGRDDQPEWSFSGESGAQFECRLTRGGTTVSDWGSCAAQAGFDLAGEPDGTYSFEVRATDDAGNTSTPGSSTYVLDRGAPAPPAIDDAPTSPAAGATPEWSFSGEAGASFECRLDRGATTVAGWGACTDPKSYALGAEPDGTYTFSVRQTDAAGNTGTPATSDYVLDRAAPAAPSIDDRPASPGRDAGPQWAFTGEAGTTLACRLTRGATTVADWASCAGTRSYDLAGEPDGTYTFAVRATDGAGNTGDDATDDYRLDRTAPGAPSIDDKPASPGDDATPQWAFSGESGAALECRVTRGGTTVADWASCATTHTYDLAGEPDGTYTFAVRATDDAGNISAAATDDYDLDRFGPPAPTIDAAPPAAGSDTSPSWRFSTAEAGATLECRTERGAGVLVHDWAACTSPDHPDLAGESDATYTFRVRARDAAGNAGPAAAATYVLDRDAPAAPTLTATPASPGSSATPSWGWTGEAGATFDCRLERDATVVADWGACTAPRSFDLASRPDGRYTLSVRATDAAGNTGAAHSGDYTLDRSPPAAPAISGGPAATSADTTPAWAFSAEAGTTSECRLIRDTSVIADWATCTVTREYDVNSYGPGTYSFAVRSRDAAGNTGPMATASYVLDLTPSGAPHIDAAPRSPGNDRSPAWSFSGQTGDSFECRIEHGAALLSDWAACASPKRYELTMQPDAGYTFSVRALDAAGNVSPAAASAYDLDTTPPAPPAVAEPHRAGRDHFPAWTFTGEGAAFECRRLQDDWAPCASPIVLDLSGMGDGIYGFTVREQDAAGNQGEPATGDYALDTTGPAVTVKVRDAGKGGASFSFSAEGGASFECRLRQGSDTVADWGKCTSPRVYDLPAAKGDETYTFAVRAIDALGNVGPVRSQAYTVPSEATDAAPAAATPANDDHQQHDGAPAAAPAPSGANAAANAPAASGATSRDAAPRRTAAAAHRPAPAAERPSAAPAPRVPHRKTPAEHRQNERKRAKKLHGAAAAAVAAVAKQVKAVARAVAKNADKSVFPMSLIFIVIGFLGLQNRIDRSDPKLSLAPVAADQEMEFGPPPTRRAMA